MLGTFDQTNPTTHAQVSANVSFNDARKAWTSLSTREFHWKTSPCFAVSLWSSSLINQIQSLLAHVQTQNNTIAYMKNEIIFLKTEVNDLERYPSKDCVIINNLPLRHGTDYVEDVIAFFGKTIDINVHRDSIVACHPLGPIRDTQNPPAIIVKFLYFDFEDNNTKTEKCSLILWLTLKMLNRCLLWVKHNYYLLYFSF